MYEMDGAKNTLPHAVKSADGSIRVKAPVAEASLTDCGGDKSPFSDGKNNDDMAMETENETGRSNGGDGTINEDAAFDLSNSFNVVEEDNGAPSDLKAEKQRLQKDLDDARSALERLGHVLFDMREFCSLPKNRNIHTQIKDGVKHALDEFLLLETKLPGIKMWGEFYAADLAHELGLKIRKERMATRDAKKRMHTAGTQTEPPQKEIASVGRAVNQKRSREPTVSPNNGTELRPLLKESRTGDSRTFREVVRRGKKVSSTPSEPEPSTSGTQNHPVNSAEKKGEKRKTEKKQPPAPEGTPGSGEGTKAKKKRRRVKPEAILINPAPGRMYADVAKEIQRAVKPENHDVEVKAIRQTKAGGVLIELRAKPEGRINFGNAIKGTLGDGGTIKHLTPRTELKIRDIVETTEVAEIQDALRKFFGGEIVGSPKINLTKRSRRGCILAFVELDAAPAAKLEKEGYLKIGWISCKVERNVPEVKCFRCHGKGHIARECTGEDRSKNCRRCGKEGHMAAACLEETEPRPPSRAKKKQ